MMNELSAPFQLKDGTCIVDKNYLFGQNQRTRNKSLDE